jgi:hypothetical protein
MARGSPDESGRSGSALTVMILPPQARSRYRCHSDRIFKTRSGSTPSFVRRRIKKRWGPPIPSCIVNCVQTSVSFPGARVVEPTTTSEGQQPSAASTRGAVAIWSGRSPTFFTRKRAWTILSNRTGPKSISSRSTTSRGPP